MDIFLSYADADRKWATDLSSHLKREGFVVRDPFKDSFPGDNIGSQIESALEESDAMVVLLSPDASQSQYVNSEIEYALGSPRYKNRLIPVVVRGSTNLPWTRFVPVVKVGRRSAAQIGRLVVDALAASTAQDGR
ncbi:MAG: toll/interleukin-1 receptor domain-containing protein [Pirellulales bacterium]